ncbi:hypothetical protein ACFQ1L_18360 [Phytohabitans flavus]
MNYLSDGLFAGRFDENPLFAGQHGGTKRGNPFPSNAAKMHY